LPSARAKATSYAPFASTFLRLDIVEVFALVIDFIGCAHVNFRRIHSNIRYIVGRLLLRGRDIIDDRTGRLLQPARTATVRALSTVTSL
jgi:hypothetical protein